MLSIAVSALSISASCWSRAASVSSTASCVGATGVVDVATTVEVDVVTRTVVEVASLVSSVVDDPEHPARAIAHRQAATGISRVGLMKIDDRPAM